jgi:hypothetical protein
MLSCASRKLQSIPDFDFNKSDDVKNSNFHNINNLFAEMRSEDKPDEYYFAVLGDSRNLVRSYDLSGFNHVAKHIVFAKDKNEEQYIYDQIKFVMHLGDFVYEGVPKAQWDNLKKAFSRKDYFDENYPYIKLLAKDKPIFPALGNHEVMKLSFKKETPYKNLAISNIGLKNFYEFFNWNSFLSNPNILYAIPSELTPTLFDSLSNRLNEQDAQLMKEYYIQLENGNFHLKVYQDIIQKYKTGEGLVEAQMNFIDPNVKSKLVHDLQNIYRKLGFNTLPVISSDNMACYAFEIDGLIYLVLDSMTRGWHYQVFSDLKTSIYHNKDHQHYLNLFSKSDLNGQYEFYKVVKNYAKENGKMISIFMHHSAINSSDNIDGGGIQYNLKLMLGIDYNRAKYKERSELEFDQNTSSSSFFDEILFINSGVNDPIMQDMFTSCVHYYQGFTLNNYIDDQWAGRFNWHITGGGGGELTRKFDNEKMSYSVMLYNERLKSISDLGVSNPSIQITDNEVKTNFNYLLVHVKGNEIVDVIPKIIPDEEVRLEKPLYNIRARFKAPVFSEPSSNGTLVSVSIGGWGFEKINPFLQFITWDPALGYGYLIYDNDGEAEPGSLVQIELLKFDLQFPQKKELSVLLGGLTDIRIEKNRSRSYFTMGVESPLIYNFFNRLHPLNLGLHYHMPLPEGEENDPDFGKNITWSFFINYAFIF